MANLIIRPAGLRIGPMCGGTLQTPTPRRGASHTTATTAPAVVTEVAADDVGVEDVVGVDTPFRLAMDPKRFLIKMSVLWN